MNLGFSCGGVLGSTLQNQVENLLHSVEQLSDDCVQFSALKMYK